ncbi:MAG: ABC transporter ATP-binding protein [Desulfovibrionales bacterium]|nr:ABC transporter ATP-binding protein [Desulfovibrionales bacterium]
MIRVSGLSLRLGDFALQDVSLHVRPGEFFALMGPTGSGKTVVLESIAGLIQWQRGEIHIAGRDVTALPPERRRVSLVYQDHALFPHLTVLENVIFGQRYHGISPADGLREANELLDRLGLSRLCGRTPENLSGGEKQRVALARALACRPNVVLLDEPLSSLDPQFRDDLRSALKTLHMQMNLTVLMVTHDFVDALSLASRAAVIRGGRMEQVGQIDEIFRQPRSTFVAAFVGMKNVFRVTSPGLCELGNGVGFAVPDAAHGAMALRPEDVFVTRNPDLPGNWICLPAKIRSVRHEGFSWFTEAVCGHAVITAALDRQCLMAGGLEPGSPVWLGFTPERLHLVPDGSDETG